MGNLKFCHISLRLFENKKKILQQFIFLAHPVDPHSNAMHNRSFIVPRVPAAILLMDLSLMTFVR